MRSCKVLLCVVSGQCRGRAEQSRFLPIPIPVFPTLVLRNWNNSNQDPNQLQISSKSITFIPRAKAYSYQTQTEIYPLVYALHPCLEFIQIQDQDPNPPQNLILDPCIHKKTNSEPCVEVIIKWIADSMRLGCCTFLICFIQ